MRSADCLRVLACVVLATLSVNVARTDEPASTEEEEIKLYLADELEWRDGPDSLLKGAQMVVLEGDPAKEGPFVFRLKFPDGFRVMPHTHPKMERVTVLAGTLNIGMGAEFDDAMTEAMPAGTFGTWPPGMKHFAWAKGETVIQLHGTGPWTINYLNPKDDPRK